MSSAQNPRITYELGMPKPSTHLFEVSITFDSLPLDEDNLDLNLPVWRPGRYLVFDFASGIQEFNVFEESGMPLKWKKINKNTWHVELNGNKSATAKYKVYANEFSLRTRGLNAEHGFVDGTSVFMYSEKYRHTPLILKVNPYDGWHVTTGLDSYNSDFSAPDYDYFVDCPLEIGSQVDIEFDVDGRKHIISIFGDAKYDRENLVRDFTKIIRQNYEFWGRVPYEEYVFIIHCTSQGGGGTEHINSCVLGIRPSALENSDLRGVPSTRERSNPRRSNPNDENKNNYKNFLRLVSHEFFHTWNVKQLRPKGITPYDYSKENYTEELWVAEGGTSYYDGLLLVRLGLLDAEDFYNELTKAIQEERRRPGNRIQSLAESSFDAWIKFWKNNPQSYNAETDYYGKGADVCLVLDLELRQRTDNKHSLDEVFKSMYEAFPLGVTGYTNSDLQKTCEDVSGTSFQQFFDDYVYGTKSIEWEKFLSYTGLDLKAEDSTVIPVVGLFAEQRGEKLFIKDILSGSSAEDAGLAAGDEVVALNHERISHNEVEKKLEGFRQGDTLVLTIFRNDKLKDYTLKLLNRKLANYFIDKTDNSAALQKSIYESWLGVKWE